MPGCTLRGTLALPSNIALHTRLHYPNREHVGQFLELAKQFSEDI